MSYALDFAPEARAAWLRLDVAVQELVLDELDRLAERPLSLPRGASVHDIIHEARGTRVYVFVQLYPDHAKLTLHVYSIGSYTRQLGQTS
jgi:mRNA-degrading endonuclease RelE of RelBE toxin-antitoxin system